MSGGFSTKLCLFTPPRLLVTLAFLYELLNIVPGASCVVKSELVSVFFHYFLTTPPPKKKIKLQCSPFRLILCGFLCLLVVQKNLEVGELLAVDVSCIVALTTTVNVQVKYNGPMRRAVFGVSFDYPSYILFPCGFSSTPPIYMMSFVFKPCVVVTVRYSETPPQGLRVVIDRQPYSQLLLETLILENL